MLHEVIPLRSSIGAACFVLGLWAADTLLGYVLLPASLPSGPGCRVGSKGPSKHWGILLTEQLCCNLAHSWTLPGSSSWTAELTDISEDLKTVPWTGQTDLVVKSSRLEFWGAREEDIWSTHHWFSSPWGVPMLPWVHSTHTAHKSSGLWYPELWCIFSLAVGKYPLQFES
jgi:hypothetical protein